MRRRFLAQLAGVPLFAWGTDALALVGNPLRGTASERPPEPLDQDENKMPEGPPGKKKLKILMKSAWGSDDPTKATFAFLHGLALAEAGHEVQIFLLGEATNLMRKTTASAVVPVGWPPLIETLEKVAAKHIPIFA